MKRQTRPIRPLARIRIRSGARRRLGDDQKTRNHATISDPASRHRPRRGRLRPAARPADYVYPVLDVSRLYAANFGELRPAHFHAGIDIKTDGVEGKPLVAVADGYVSRVSLAARGRTGGLPDARQRRRPCTATCRSSRDDIEKTRARRALPQPFERRGPPIRRREGGRPAGATRSDFSGSSGSSMGPHLHFELRDTPTQRLPQRRARRGDPPEDDLPPRIMRLLHRGRYAGRDSRTPPSDQLRGARARESRRPATALTREKEPATSARPQRVLRGRGHRPPQRRAQSVRRLARRSRWTANPASNTAWTASRDSRAAAAP